MAVYSFVKDTPIANKIRPPASSCPKRTHHGSRRTLHGEKRHVMGEPNGRHPESDRPSSLRRASSFIKNTPGQVAAQSPPVNRRIPVARKRLEAIRKIFGV